MLKSILKDLSDSSDEESSVGGTVKITKNENSNSSKINIKSYNEINRGNDQEFKFVELSASKINSGRFGIPIVDYSAGFFKNVPKIESSFTCKKSGNSNYSLEEISNDKLSSEHNCNNKLDLAESYLNIDEKINYADSGQDSKSMPVKLIKNSLVKNFLIPKPKNSSITDEKSKNTESLTSGTIGYSSFTIDNVLSNDTSIISECKNQGHDETLTVEEFEEVNSQTKNHENTDPLIGISNFDEDNHDAENKLVSLLDPFYDTADEDYLNLEDNCNNNNNTTVTLSDMNKDEYETKSISIKKNDYESSNFYSTNDIKSKSNFDLLDKEKIHPERRFFGPVFDEYEKSNSLRNSGNYVDKSYEKILMTYDMRENSYQDDNLSGMSSIVPNKELRNLNNRTGIVKSISATELQDSNWIERLSSIPNVGKRRKFNLPTKVYNAVDNTTTYTTEPKIMQRRRHQINWLAKEAQEKEMEIMEITSHTRRSKYQTQMKYGW